MPADAGFAMLIRVPEHEPRDLLEWERAARADPVTAKLASHKRRIERARKAIAEFAALGSCYAGTSWGKDSTVLAHLIATSGLSIPLVWVRVEPIANPHCTLVRDAFLTEHPSQPYDEVEVWCTLDDQGWHATGTLERGFAEVASRYAARHISGIRADESGQRKRRCTTYGEDSGSTCAPLAWWAGSDVFAYLHKHSLPVHPAYAMSLGGSIERERLRVASLGGKRGTGHGRQQWEEHYYRDAMRRIRECAGPTAPTP